MRELCCRCVLWRMFYSERGYCEKKKRKIQRVCCRLYPFILLDNKKEGPDNFSGGHSPHWVNHIHMCLYCIMYLLCFISTFVYFISPRSYFTNITPWYFLQFHHPNRVQPVRTLFLLLMCYLTTCGFFPNEWMLGRRLIPLQSFQLAHNLILSLNKLSIHLIKILGYEINWVRYIVCSFFFPLV
jgi:hypothetical protein